MAYPSNTNTGAKNLVDFVLAVREAWQNATAALTSHKSDPSGHPLATQSVPGFMSAADKTKLDTGVFLTDGSVATARLADRAVTTAKVASKAVTADKLADTIDLGGL